MRILNFGSLNIDKVYRVAHFVKPGETLSSESYKCFPGGKGLNQSIAIARAGERVFHAGTIGADGRFLKELLNENGVNTEYIQESANENGHALIQVSDEGENCIILFKGSNYENDRSFMNRVLEKFDSGDILVLQNEINDLECLLRAGSRKKMRILLNASPVNEELRQTDLSGVTWLMVNETEGRELTGEGGPDQIACELQRKYPSLNVILTLGTDGCIFRNARQRIFQPCFVTQTVDSTAAGDTFTGYFIASVMKGRSMEEALEAAACAASITVSGEGASVSIPFYEEVEKRLASYRAEG